MTIIEKICVFQKKSVILHRFWEIGFNSKLLEQLAYERLELLEPLEHWNTKTKLILIFLKLLQQWQK